MDYAEIVTPYRAEGDTLIFVIGMPMRPSMIKDGYTLAATAPPTAPGLCLTCFTRWRRTTST